MDSWFDNETVHLFGGGASSHPGDSSDLSLTAASEHAVGTPTRAERMAAGETAGRGG